MPFDAEIKLRVPRYLDAAAREGARRELTNVSAYMRRALLTQLRSDGVKLPQHEEKK